MTEELISYKPINNYAIQGEVKLMWNDEVMLSGRFNTRWQRWRVEDKFIKLVKPLLPEKKFYFKVSHVEHNDDTIQRKLGTNRGRDKAWKS